MLDDSGDDRVAEYFSSDRCSVDGADGVVEPVHVADSQRHESVLAAGSFRVRFIDPLDRLGQESRQRLVLSVPEKSAISQDWCECYPLPN